MPPLPPGPTAVPRRTAQVTQTRGLGTGASGAQCHALGSAQHRLAQHSWHPTGGPVTRGFMPRSGDRAPRRGTAEVTGAVHAQSAALPSKDQGALLTHMHAHYTHTHKRTPCTLLRVQGMACSQALPHAHTHPPEAALSTTVPTHAEGSLPPCCTRTLLRGDPPTPALRPLPPVPPWPAQRGSPRD